MLSARGRLRAIAQAVCSALVGLTSIGEGSDRDEAAGSSSHESRDAAVTSRIRAYEVLGRWHAISYQRGRRGVSPGDVFELAGLSNTDHTLTQTTPFDRRSECKRGYK